MKRLCLILAVVLTLGIVPIYAEDNVAVTVTYKSGISNTQGQDNFYMCVFKGKNEELLKWDGNSQKWVADGTSAFIKYDFMNPYVGEDVGLKFVAPTTGMVRLRGTIAVPYPDVSKGNGYNLSILKGSKEVWKAGPTKNNESYDTVISVKAGETIYFKSNANNNEAYDWVYWWPTVEYLAMDYENDDKSLYFQKDAKGMTQLEFSKTTYGYTAADGTAFISKTDVFPTEKYSMVKRDVVEENGRYRLYSPLFISDLQSGGNVVTVYKNNDKIWEQFIVAGEEQYLDIGFWANKGDVIDTEVSVSEFTGYNHTEWDCNLTRYILPYVHESSTAVKRNCGVEKSYELGSFVGASQGSNGCAFYTLKNDKEYPMTYDSRSKRWISSVSGDGGYISSTEAYPGTEWQGGVDSVMEFPLPESGIINLNGIFNINSASDGVLIKIYINDELLWTNRVGGERAVRWDEPYDICYFQNTVNTVAKVEQGDVMKISFNGWRRKINDNVGLSDVYIDYVGKNVISDTTRFKIDNSILVDVTDKAVYLNGERKDIDIMLYNDSVYVAETDILTILNNEKISAESVSINGVSYIPLRVAAESVGKSVEWTADRMAIIYDSIPVFFGFDELSEIKTTLEIGGDLFE